MVLSILRKRRDLFTRHDRGVYGLTEWARPSAETGGGRTTETRPADEPNRKSPQPEGFIDDEGLLGPRTTEFAGVQMLDAAAKILGEQGRPMHYREIAKIAVHRGYSSGRGTGFKSLSRSFWSLLQRDCQKSGSRFRMAGQGMFALRENDAAEHDGSREATGGQVDEE